MTNNENMWAWVQNIHLPNKGKTDLQKRKF